MLPHDPNSIYLPPVPLPVPVVDPAAAVDAVAQSLGATMDQLQDPESCLVRGQRKTAQGHQPALGRPSSWGWVLSNLHALRRLKCNT